MNLSACPSSKCIKLQGQAVLRSKKSLAYKHCKQRYQQVPVPEETSLSANALPRKEKNDGRQEDSLQDLSERR
jgi:hypothetical protein